MKHTLFILAILTASIQTFAQSPRIKLNQITKDSVTGSVLISSPTDSGMVYSRDLFISYGADTVLILAGDTLAVTSGIISSVLSDGVTITGNGTSGSELTADTSVLATLRALSDSLALVISSVTADGVTITGDGTVGSPLKVDTATVIATKQDLDLYYLDSNPDGYTSNTGTVTSVAATAGTGISVSGSPITTSGTLTITNTAPDQTVSIAGGGINAVSGTYPSFTVTGTEVDGSVTNEIQDISTSGAAGNISISSGSTLNLNVDDADASATNEGSLTVGAGTASTSVISSNTSGSTDVTLTAGTNVTLSETGNNITISATGGGTTFNNISETVDTVYISDYLDVDTSTLYVDATNNMVGIGTTSPSAKLEVIRNGYPVLRAIRQLGGTGTLAGAFALARDNTYLGNSVTVGDGVGFGFDLKNSADVYNLYAGVYGQILSATDGSEEGQLAFAVQDNGGTLSNNIKMVIDNNGNVGIGTTSPQAPLDISVPNTNPGGTQWLGINQTGGDGYFQVGSGSGATGSFSSVFEMQSEGNDEYVASFVGLLPEVNDVTNSNRVATLMFSAYERNSDGSVGALENADLFSFTNYTTAVMKIEADGDVLIPSLASISNIDADANGRLYDASDESLKNIIKTKTNGLSELLNIEPIYFTWKDVSRFSPETFIGFSAQNVEQALPEAAYRVPSKGYMSVRTDAILATAVVSIQEQQAIIESQATEIESLKTLITELSNRLTILENN